MKLCGCCHVNQFSIAWKKINLFILFKKMRQYPRCIISYLHIVRLLHLSKHFLDATFIVTKIAS